MDVYAGAAALDFAAGAASRPDITLAALREALGLTCALSTLHYVLVAMGLTFKKDVARGRAGARADIKAGRRRWKSKRRNWHRSRLVFIDEAGAKTNMTRRYGRARRGRRCHDSAPHGHGATTSIIASVRSDGSTTHTTVSGATNTENFRSYVRDVLAPTLRRGDIVVLDNLPPHKNKETLEIITRAGARVAFLPAYSPDLNPIEKMGSKIKACLRSTKARTLPALINAIQSAFSSVSTQDVIGWFTSCGYT
ncbi:IS630 family transposase [Verrucomicrobia bacterium LW23]|nr:IS630 family transposase [Verrucomicrobia bacterium LW23]